MDSGGLYYSLWVLKVGDTFVGAGRSCFISTRQQQLQEIFRIKNLRLDSQRYEQNKKLKKCHVLAKTFTVSWGGDSGFGEGENPQASDECREY